jgi:cleavage and polyadenylation specificity factor subunit 1
MYLPEINACQLELISPVTWETVDIIKMGEGEQIISLATVELSSKENTSGFKTYVAVGTGFMRSEDLPCRGRVSNFDVVVGVRRD